MKNRILTKLTAVSTVALTLLSVSAGAPVSANARKTTTTKPRVERVARAKKGTKAVVPKLTGKTSKKGVKKALKKHIVKKVTKRAKSNKASNKPLSNAQMYKFLSSFYSSKGSITVTRKNKRTLQRESFSLLGGNIPVRNRMQLNVIGNRNIKAGTQYLVSYVEPVGNEGNFTFYGYVQTPNKKVTKTTKKVNKSRKGTKRNKSSKRARKHMKRNKREKRNKHSKRSKRAKLSKHNKKFTKKNLARSKKDTKRNNKVNHKATSKAPVSVRKGNATRATK